MAAKFLIDKQIFIKLFLLCNLVVFSLLLLSQDDDNMTKLWNQPHKINILSLNFDYHHIEWFQNKNLLPAQYWHCSQHIVTWWIHQNMLKKVTLWIYQIARSGRGINWFILVSFWSEEFYEKGDPIPQPDSKTSKNHKMDRIIVCLEGANN